MATRAPGSVAGSASSTTMTRFRVEVVSTTIAPSAVWTSPSRTIPSQPSVAAVIVRPQGWTAQAAVSMPKT